METQPLKQEQQGETLTVPAFGYELIREDVLQDLLGKDAAALLYWAGKRLARKYPLTSTDEIITFFKQAGWGYLSIKKETNSKIDFELTSELLNKRLQSDPPPHFQLEAGFLAEQMQLQKQCIAETFEHPKKRAAKVTFTVKWDPKDPV